MNACHLLRRLLPGLILLPFIAVAQNSFVRTAVYPLEGAGGIVMGNIPMNEVNIHAYRHFHKRWPLVTDEKWSRTGDGYIVNFRESSFPNRVYFNQRGGFLYAVKYYPGDHIAPEQGEMVKTKYPDYSIKVVTEITDGTRTIYLMKIENRHSVKTLSLIDGKLEVSEDLINGGANGSLSRD